MYLLDISKQVLFGRDDIEPDNARAVKFITGLRNLAVKNGGRINKVEFSSRVIRVTIARAKVRDGLLAYFRARKIEPVEVELLDEFFAEGATGHSK